MRRRETQRARYNRLARRAITAVRRLGGLTSDELVVMLDIDANELHRVAGSPAGSALECHDGVWTAPGEVRL